ncbi:hypothetical protein [Streptomyces sp. Tue6028]|uniref:hypothetical protein n=1 Tax=Streptomyces sp. Tue6028 TaxID=2036037 RepID=UPI001180EE8E|nr:hypothetical protein [Streptomyces sp. Tue6028]
MTGPNQTTRRLTLSAAVVASVLCAALTACSGGDVDDSGQGGGRAGATSSPAPERSSAVPDSDAVLSQKDQVKNALPDLGAVGGLEGVSGDVNTADGHLDCPSPQECKGKWYGHDKFALSGDTYYVNFEITTYTSRQDAKDGLKVEVGDNPTLSKPTFGNESQAYTKEGGGLTGEYITMRVGTVVATTFVEGGESEPMLTQGATMFAQRIAQVQAGKKVTATLPQY